MHACGECGHDCDCGSGLPRCEHLCAPALASFDVDDAPTHRSFFKSDLKTRVDLAGEREAAEDRQWRICCKAVDARDHRRCRCCGKRSDPDAIGLLVKGHRHHIVYRSAGGADISQNVVTLCATCHDDEHVKTTLRLEGDADQGLEFWRRINIDSEWYLVQRELAPWVPERD